MGLLDWIIGWFFFPNSDVAVYYSSQGRFFCFTHSGPKRSYLVNKLISGPDFLKNDNIWSDFTPQSTSKYETYAPA